MKSHPEISALLVNHMGYALPSLTLHFELIILLPEHECVLHALSLIPVVIRHIIETGGAILPAFVHLLAGCDCPRIPSCAERVIGISRQKEDDTRRTQDILGVEANLVCIERRRRGGSKTKWQSNKFLSVIKCRPHRIFSGHHAASTGSPISNLGLSFVFPSSSDAADFEERRGRRGDFLCWIEELDCFFFCCLAALFFSV